MLYDVVTPSSYRTFNVTIAHIIGLVNAVYCSELLDIYSKAKRKNTIDSNGFFPLNRNYVKIKTSIAIDEQYVCDASLSKVDLVKTSKDNPDVIKFDVEQFMRIIAEEDSKVLSQIHKKIVFSKNDGESKELKRMKIKDNLLKVVSYDDAKVVIALKEWVEHLFESDKISSDTIREFQTTLKNYAKTNTTIALKLITIAKAQCFTSCVDAIKQYEQEQEVLKSKRIRTTNFKVATSDNLSDKKY